MLIPSIKRYAIGAGLAVLVLGALHGCTDLTQEVLPEGPQTMTGVLQPVSLSLKRRGTHVLLQQGERVYLVESARTDLRDYEGVDVVLTGVIERNTDPEALPVLLASGVRLVDMPVRQWVVDGLFLTVDAPASWYGAIFPDGIRFTETGSTAVVLSIHTASLTQLPAGAPLQVAGRKAVMLTQSGAQIVYVQNGSAILAFSFVPSAAVHTPFTEQDVNRVLRSVVLGRMVNSSSSALPASARSTRSAPPGSAPSTDTSSATTGAPCGGPAGILCPSGQYCHITEPVDGVGRCRALKR